MGIRALATCCMAFTVSAAAAQEPGLIRDWLVLGTFPNDDADTLLTAPYVEDEASTAPWAGMPAAGREWRLQHAGDAGNLNFAGMGFDETESCAVYAQAYVRSDEERNVLVLVGSDDGVMLRVNGRVVHANKVWRGWKMDQDRVVARLG